MSTAAHRIAALETQLVHFERVTEALRLERDAAIRCRELAEELVFYMKEMILRKKQQNG